MQLEDCGACANYLAPLTSSISCCADGIESAFCRRQLSTTGQRSKTLRPGVLHLHQRRWNDAPGSAKIPPMVSKLHPSARLCLWQRVRKASKLERPTSAKKRLRLDRCGRSMRPNSAITAVSKAARHPKQSASVRSPLIA